uniref:Uncharacterized protein n=1 Tax=Mastacembelus armatus TaxID=205130 RepID=A0A3Q3RT34_9TELE
MGRLAICEALGLAGEERGAGVETWEGRAPALTAGSARWRPGSRTEAPAGTTTSAHRSRGNCLLRLTFSSRRRLRRGCRAGCNSTGGLAALRRGNPPGLIASLVPEKGSSSSEE